MKKHLASICVLGSWLVPAGMALAHGGEDDGHVEAEALADPSTRIYVMIGVAVVFALMIGWLIWSKIKSAPPKDSPPST